MEPEKADNSLMNLPLCYERKPQFVFKCVLADNSFSPFEHLNVPSSTENCHPFRKEIGALIDNPPEHSFWTSFTKEDTSKDCMWVDSSLQLRELANKLAEQNVFAVDTEQHNLRSYLGFTALMQISTREEDYLVDTVALHDEMALLRPIFSNPRICKVFHGAQNYIIWLQRDFHIYLVNIFDTYTACLLLEKPQKSLEGLLQTICNVDTDKTLRTRDWTERPLPPTMLRYARTDTQYLLWIADVLTAELKEVKKYDESIRRSNKVCLTLYAKGQEDFKLANREQYDCRERAWKLCIWRDLMARIHDESREFVLSNEVMLKFARKVPTIYDVFKSTDDADQRRGRKIDGVSAIFLCHHDDYFNQIISDKSVALDTVFPLILQKCLGMNGTCGINLLNCSLLGNFRIIPFSPLVKKSGKQTSKVSQIPIRKPDVAVYESDGTLKFWCNHGKGQWYLKMGLAEQTQIHGEYALQLKTETLGGPEKCQKIALEAGERYKKTMSSRCEVSQSSHQKMVEAKEYVNIRRAAAALLDRPTIPESRREEYMEIVERHYGRSNLSREDLEGVRKIGLMSCKEEKNETSVEKQIIDNLLKNSGEDGVKRFCEEWKQQFVNDLHPTNLP
uniref:3'-5' exonuclease domain-containing protein n=2 Tax=Brassica oleracea TaxID=3712 RepID=A0A0D3ECA2_BRAOL